MLKHIPGVERASWLSRKWFVETIGSIPPLIIAAIASYRFLQDPATLMLGYLSAGAGIWLLVASIIKVGHARQQDRESAAKRDHDGLRAALWVLHASAGHACNLDQATVQDTLRVTFHRVVPPLEDAQEIEQIVPYVGGKGGGEGRRFSVRSGITGRCIRTKEPHTMHRQDDDVKNYRKDLEANWSYTSIDAAKLSTEPLSSMAVPVQDKSGHHALGVIYFDSKEKDLFNNSDVQSAILEACAGVTRYVGERYGK